MSPKTPPKAVPEVVIMRLPLYLRALTLLEGTLEIISSQELGERLQLTPAQIRKDLSYFGKFGKQGRGYTVKTLIREIKRILGLNQEWNMALVGVGRLGRAILDYARFARSGFRIVAAFDADPSLVGKRAGGVVIQDMSELAATIASKKIAIGIVAVPVGPAQAVMDALVKAGIRAILNYAPIAARVPPGVRIRDIDPVVAAQSMTYYLNLDTSQG